MMGLRTALFWLGLLLAIGATWLLLDLPSDAELKVIVTTWITTYGLPLVFIGALLEAILFVGLYWPGSLVIFLGVALAPNPKHAVAAVLCVSVGMLIGYSINYALGKYGWYRLFVKLGMQQMLSNAEQKMQENDVRYVLYTFWNPGLAAFTATAAGTLQIGYRHFMLLAIGAVALWNTFWGVVVYSLGETAVNALDFRVIIGVISLWVLFEVVMTIRKKYQATS